MAKSMYLSVLLFIGALFLHWDTERLYIDYRTDVEAGKVQPATQTPPDRPARPLDLGSPTSSQRLKQIYDSQIGVREQGQNSGPQVEQYLKYAGLDRGNPWCAAFVCWVLGEAGIANPRSGWSPDLFAPARVIWPKGMAAAVFQAGDVFGIYFNEKKRIAHAGFIDRHTGSWLITVEGNTNDSGGQEGDEVYRKRRLVSSISQVARYLN